MMTIVMMDDRNDDDADRNDDCNANEADDTNNDGNDDQKEMIASFDFRHISLPKPLRRHYGIP